MNSEVPTYSLENAAEFVRNLANEGMNHRVINHPYLLALKNGTLPNPSEALKDFSYQYLAYSNDFIRFLTATIAQVEDREHRAMLTHNLIEESGQVSDDDAHALEKIGIKLEWVAGVPHPQLFRRYLDAIGCDSKFRNENNYCDDATVWKNTFFLVCSTGGAAQALGAMGLGTENIVKFIYKHILEAIAKYLPVTPRERVFFDMHAEIDDEHGEVMNNILIELAQYHRNRVAMRQGMLMALNLRTAFFDAMKVRAETMFSSKSTPTNTRPSAHA